MRSFVLLLLFLLRENWLLQLTSFEQFPYESSVLNIVPSVSSSCIHATRRNEQKTRRWNIVEIEGKERIKSRSVHACRVHWNEIVSLKLNPELLTDDTIVASRTIFGNVDGSSWKTNRIDNSKRSWHGTRTHT